MTTALIFWTALALGLWLGTGGAITYFAKNKARRRLEQADESGTSGYSQVA